MWEGARFQYKMATLFLCAISSLFFILNTVRDTRPHAHPDEKNPTRKFAQYVCVCAVWRSSQHFFCHSLLFRNFFLTSFWFSTCFLVSWSTWWPLFLLQPHLLFLYFWQLCSAAPLHLSLSLSICQELSRAIFDMKRSMLLRWEKDDFVRRKRPGHSGGPVRCHFVFSSSSPVWILFAFPMETKSRQNLPHNPHDDGQILPTKKFSVFFIIIFFKPGQIETSVVFLWHCWLALPFICVNSSIPKRLGILISSWL